MAYGSSAGLNRPNETTDKITPAATVGVVSLGLVGAAVRGPVGMGVGAALGFAVGVAAGWAQSPR